MIENLDLLPHDPLLALIGQFTADVNPEKIDLGVGVYRDGFGKTPVMQSVKKAEQLLVEAQQSKVYLGMLGSISFIQEIEKLTFDDMAGDKSRLFGMQTTGGTAAIRFAADLIKQSNADACIWLGTPTWINHKPILQKANLRIAMFPYYDAENHSIDFDKMMNALAGASVGDVVLMQACCHNPTGCDLTPEQWQQFADLCNKLGLIPFIDSAYQGLGDGLNEDREGISVVARTVPEAIFSISCSKNFGLYRERTGAIFVLGKNEDAKAIAQSQLFSIARASYSMPPDHGAAVAAMILQTPELRKNWESELGEMRLRISQTRIDFVKAWGESTSVDVSFLNNQKGMFSMFPLSLNQITHIKDNHSIYMADDGRVNMAGLKPTDIVRVVNVFKEIL